MLRTILFASAALALAGSANAAERTPRPDPWGDATVARGDVAARSSQQFDTLDTNRDGSLSGDELAAMAPQGAQRGGRMRGRGAGMMSQWLDTNGDGKISRDEFAAAALRRFDMADADHDGRLTKAERDTAREAMRARWRERMQDGGMQGGMMGGGANPPANDDGQ